MMKRSLIALSLAAIGLSAMAQTTVPCTLDIPDEATFTSSWTVIDNNASVSANTWKYNSQDALYPEDKQNAADDWLISPGVQLEAGASYTIKYYIEKVSTYSSDKSAYAITIGTDKTIEAQSTVLASNDAFKSQLYSAQEVTFAPKVSGVYYLGVHCTTGRYQGSTGFQKFVISQNVVRPLAPTNVTLANEGGKAVLTWSAPAKNTADADVDPATVSYRIVRNPDGVEVATGLKATTLTDATLPTALASYSYTVYATVNGQEGEGATSNGLVFGDALEVPFESKLTDEGTRAIWSVVDANADGKTWAWNSSNSGMAYTSYKSADDWLFTPPFTTVAGKHKVKIGLKGYNYRYSDAFDVVLATTTATTTVTSVARKASTVAGSTIIKSYDDGALGRSLYDTDSIEFDVTAAGTYYIGIHDVSTSPWGLYVNGLAVELVEAAPVTGVTDVLATDRARYDAASQSLVLPAEGQVTIVNLSGAVVATEASATSVNLAGLPAGIYVAQVRTAAGVQGIKFVK